MPDIFDEVDAPAAAKGDIFDEVGGGGDIFDEVAPAQTGMDMLRRVPAGIAKSAADTVVGVSRIAELFPLAKTLKAIPGNEDLIKGTQEYFAGLGESAAGVYGVDEAQNQTIPSKLISGVSSIVPAIASGPAAPLAMAGLMGESQRQEAEAMGGTESQQTKALIGGATVGALSEFLLGVPALLRSAKAAGIPEATFKAISKEAAVQAVKGAGREGVQEGLDQIGQNIVAAKIASYDPERKTFANVPEAVAFGAAIGAPVGATVQAAASLDAISAQSRATAEQVNSTVADVAAAEPPPISSEPIPEGGEPTNAEAIRSNEGQIRQAYVQEAGTGESGQDIQQPAPIPTSGPQDEVTVREAFPDLGLTEAQAAKLEEGDPNFSEKFFQKLSPEKSAEVDAWLYKNEAAVTKRVEGRWYADRLNKLGRMSEDAADFGQEFTRSPTA